MDVADARRLRPSIFLVQVRVFFLSWAHFSPCQVLAPDRGDTAAGLILPLPSVCLLPACPPVRSAGFILFFFVARLAQLLTTAIL